jgi:glycosyltransferase involved in cell wall biosynthesis
MPTVRDGGAVLVLPTTTAGQQGPVASWISTAGWASAADRVLGAAWIVTPDGIVTPSDARRRGSHAQLASRAPTSWRRRLPTVGKTAVKDVRQWRRARQFRVDPHGPWEGKDLAFVWQRHELFHTAGLELARGLRVPSVLFAPATLVWEAKEWGVERPGWRGWLERTAEAPALRGADLVACGSDIVAEQAERIGTPPDRILVTPTGVDVELFSSTDDSGARRRELGLDGRFVVGWVGSFRRFHAVELAVEAVARVDGAALLLVGDGPERATLEAAGRRLGVDVVMTGTVPHADLPGYLGAMDAGLVLAESSGVFHYSPLKLAEYLAAGLAVVAPRIPSVEERVTDEETGLLVAPGDLADLVAALVRLRDDVALRQRLSSTARAAAQRWSWDRQVERVLAALG